MEYFKRNTDLQFIKYPKFLFSEEYSVKISVTAKIIYALLFDRARLSAANTDYIDENGNVFIIFTIAELSKIICKSDMTVKNSLKMLEENNLILRKFIGVGKPTHIYILYPDNSGNKNALNGKISLDSNVSNQQNTFERNVSAKGPAEERNITATQKENDASCGKKIVDCEERKLSGNKNKYNKNNILRRESKSSTPADKKLSFGEHNNVLLTQEELSELKRDIPKWEYYINRLSQYMFSKGRYYDNHAFTIRQWAEQDGNIIKRADYSGGDDECI